MPCWTPAEPTLVSCRNGVGLAAVYGGDKTLTRPASSASSSRPSGRNSIVVGRSNPVASTSFRKVSVLSPLTVTPADVVGSLPRPARGR